MESIDKKLTAISGQISELEHSHSELDGIQVGGLGVAISLGALKRTIERATDVARTSGNVNLTDLSRTLDSAKTQTDRIWTAIQSASRAISDKIRSAIKAVLLLTSSATKQALQLLKEELGARFGINPRKLRISTDRQIMIAERLNVDRYIHYLDPDLDQFHVNDLIAIEKIFESIKFKAAAEETRKVRAIILENHMDISRRQIVELISPIRFHLMVVATEIDRRYDGFVMFKSDRQ